MLKFILIILLIRLNLCLVNAKFNQLNIRSPQDLPLQQDLDSFLQPIETLSNYLSDNVTDIEINFALGLFFTNVHLGRILFDKGHTLPTEIVYRIKKIFDRNEESLYFFHKIAKKDFELLNRDHMIISDLFVNSTYWMHRLKTFKYEDKPTYSREYLEKIYSEWKKYMENVDNVYIWTPNPKNSDICLVTLSINPKAKGNLTSWCPIAKTCYQMLTEGTNFGYALCHRLVLLITAELGRGCSILTVREDEELKQNFCTKAYAEAQYIAMNDYGIVDLMFEIMCLCATDGRLQFLRRSWLYKMFDYQNENGCFGPENTIIAPSRRTKLAGCNSHTTSLASGTYAAANLHSDQDLTTYIESLKSVTKYFENNPNIMDINSIFSLFIINVNFKHILAYGKGLSSSQRQEMLNIIKSNEKTEKNSVDRKIKDKYAKIATLFSNSTLMVNHLNNFTYTQQEHYSKSKFEAKFPDFAKYKTEALSTEHGTPNRDLSNICLALLSESPMNTNKRLHFCPLEQPCYEALKNGTEFGLSLSHRILWLVLARFARGCHILSSRRDKQLTEKLCSMAFAESEYIAAHNYEASTVMFEFICVCSLGGHAEFLQKHWLDTMLDYQTNSGCFKDPVEDDYELDILKCGYHLTALSVCSISSALRYIVEK